MNFHPPVSWSKQRTQGRVVRRAVEVSPEAKNAEDLELGESRVGKVLEVNKFGAVVDLGVDRRCWLHVSEMKLPEGMTRIEDPNEVMKKDQEVAVRIREVKAREVKLTMLDLPEFQKKPLSDFQEGDEVDGRVAYISPKFGLFVDVGAMVNGLVPKKNLKGAKPTQFQEGLEVKVKVETVTSNRITLALESEEVDNILGLAEDLELGESRVGKVLEVNKFGAAVDLGVDRQCWLHVSEMELPEGMTRIEDPNEVMKKDQEVAVRIREVRAREVKLTMLDLPEFQKKPLSDFQEGDEVEGRVADISPKAGLFVDVGAMVNGLVPKDTLKGKEPSQFQIGQEVKVKVQNLTKHQMNLLLEEVEDL